MNKYIVLLLCAILTFISTEARPRYEDISSSSSEEDSEEDSVFPEHGFSIQAHDSGYHRENAYKNKFVSSSRGLDGRVSSVSDDRASINKIDLKDGYSDNGYSSSGYSNREYGDSEYAKVGGNEYESKGRGRKSHSSDTYGRNRDCCNGNGVDMRHSFSSQSHHDSDKGFVPRSCIDCSFGIGMINLNPIIISEETIN